MSTTSMLVAPRATAGVTGSPDADPFRLRGIPAFRDAADDVLRHLSAMLSVGYVDVGSLVIGGRDLCALVILADGRAETVCHEGHGHHPVRRIVDAAFGPRVLALFPGDRPGLLVRAHTPLTLLCLRRHDSEALARQHPAIAHGLRRATAHRGHRSVGARVVGLRPDGPTGPAPQGYWARA